MLLVPMSRSEISLSTVGRPQQIQLDSPALSSLNVMPDELSAPGRIIKVIHFDWREGNVAPVMPILERLENMLFPRLVDFLTDS